MERNKIIIASDGYATQIFVDGKVYGDYIECLTFYHEASDAPQIHITASHLPVEGNSSIDTFKRLLERLLEVETPVTNTTLMIDGTEIYKSIRAIKTEQEQEGGE